MASLLITVILAIVILEVISRDQCENNKSNQCMCLHSYEYEFQCPSPPADFNLLIHSVPEQELSIECQDMDKLDMKLLPDYKAGDNTSVTIKHCPLPDDNFQSILNRFEIRTFSSLTLENVSIPQTSINETISKNVFSGLSSVTDLTLSYIYPKFDDDILEFLPNLRHFEMEHINIEDISTFNFPPSLIDLLITGNFISDVGSGVFQNLHKLSKLHLWGNKITSIRKDAFLGLKKLVSLELSANKIQEIEEGSFDDLIDLSIISLRLNKIHKVRHDIFRHNKNLTSIRLDENSNLILPDYVFAKLQKLRIVYLKNSSIENIPEHIFEGSTAIEQIFLQSNHLKNISESLFKGLTSLKTLDLSRNELSSLPNKIFSSLNSLTELNLSFNNISEITEELFKNTRKLEKLMLNNNKITFIEFNSFLWLNDSLNFIDLSNNLYKMSYNIGGNPLNNCLNLQKVYLRNNLIEEFPDFNTLLHLEEVDLSYNKMRELSVLLITTLPSNNLKSINLSNNEITSVDNFLPYNYSDETKQIQVNLKNNPLVCDCANYNLVQYCRDDLDPTIKARVNLQVEGIYCAQPPTFRHIKITELKPSHVSCEQNFEGCPKQCTSYWRPFKSLIVIDCSNRNLTSFPKISVTKPHNIEINLSGNNIRNGLNSSLGYENVKHLFLSNNKLQELKWIPPGIEQLSLDQNELTHLEPELLEIMNKTSLKTLKLANNPWSCGCSALNFQIFIQDNYQKFQINSTDVLCRDDNKPLVEKRELCKSSSTLILMTVLPILSFLLLTVAALIFYIYYRQEVKIWLFSKNLCLWFVSEEELDEDKKYDIFISYSHKDEDFVVQNLLPVLESGPHPFKTCIHIRDWAPGEMILTHVTNSVENSKRTLVVLSNNFLESVWGIVEFKQAHMKALKEGRSRLVVVKYGELDKNKLDNDLKAYLSTNTYIEWGKPWFWNKLKYALPHSSKRGFYNSNQKHANVMLKIDDKFELTTIPSNPLESTPPVITLDPALLVNRSLETPLVVNT